MLYASKNVKGLGLFRATWEAFLQNYNICVRLASCDNEYLPYVRDLKHEMESCLKALKIEDGEMEEIIQSRKSTKKLRDTLRKRSYTNWCNLPTKGKGVVLYQECQSANKWIHPKEGLSTSEWVNTIKMTADVAAVRALQGRSQDGNHCRFCSEIETLAHVLGKCPRGEQLRTTRHHNVRSLLANALRNQKWIVQEEVHCVSAEGSNRRIDILAYDANSLTGYVIDPTVRFECHIQQPSDVDIEKRNIYNPCVPDLCKKFQIKSLEVIGLFIGSRGTITNFFEVFRKKFMLPKSVTKDILLSVIKNSVKILNNHIYTK